MDLYHRPASRFVAEFIGSPRINLLAGVLRCANAELAVVDVAGHVLNAAVDATHLSAGAAVQVAVRPEHGVLGDLAASDAANGAASPAGAVVLPARVEHLERLGESSLLYLMLNLPGPPRPLVVRVEGHAEATLGDVLAVTLHPQALHVFDSDGQACRRTVLLPR